MFNSSPITHAQDSPRDSPQDVQGIQGIQDVQDVQANPWDKVILRIDDAPSQYTSELLETLQALGIKHVIFNLVGKYIVKKDGSIAPETAQVVSDIIYKYRYEVGIHTFSHPNLSLKRIRKRYENDLKKWEKEIDDTQEAINLALKLLNQPLYQCRLFATPGGPQNLSPKLKGVIKAKGLEIDEGWDIDSRDSLPGARRLSPQAIAKQIKALSQHQEQIVLLIHDRKGGWAEELKTIDQLNR